MTAHGTVASYVAGCHKECCRRAVRAYEAKRQYDRLHGLHRTLPATGTRRRLQALARIGWPARDLAARLGGTHPQTLQRLLRPDLRSLTTPATAAAVRDLYDQLWDKPGPSLITRRRAERNGWLPPMAWDDDTIDDPRLEPDSATSAQRRVHVEDIEWLVAAGGTWESVQARTGFCKDTIETACRRAGRLDLIDALIRASGRDVPQREAS